ncbi:hypothetical protein E4099_27510 [Streptomyces palmae]|uniref:Uncharacterized protein n=1 Tax=Streptomyces palmae TaxID=1701085 RepID=A0A4Z0GB63_9ACTN|nr:hypothetical protein E4099_27510 [Streptomyces palmae]
MATGPEMMAGSGAAPKDGGAEGAGPVRAAGARWAVGGSADSGSPSPSPRGGRGTSDAADRCTLARCADSCPTARLAT